MIAILGKHKVRFWIDRLAPFLILSAIILVLINLYNVWSGLTLFYLIRRNLISISLIVLILGPSILFRKNKSRLIYLLVMSFLISLILIINFTYHKYAGGYLSVSALRYAKHLFSVSGSVKTLLSVKQLILLAPVIVAAGLLIFFKGDKQSEGKLNKKEYLVLTSLMIFTILAGTGYTFYKEYKEWGDVSRLVNHPYNSDDLVRKVGIINYGIYDVAKYTTKKKGLDAKEVEFVQQTAKNYTIPQSTNEMTGVLKDKNIIYIQLESFQNFLIGQKVNGVEVTPNLNRLASQSYNFTNFHYQAGPGTSSDTEFVMLNSLYHLGDKSVNFEYTGNKFYALPQFLKNYGYATVAMHGDSPNFWNRGTIFANFGYDKFITVGDYKGDHVLWGTNDIDFMSQSADKLSQMKQPFFAHVISLSSHSPFKLPENLQKLDLSSVKISQLQKDYLQSAHYTDSALGKMIEILKQDGLYDKSAIIVSGDHEGFIATKDDADFARFLGYENSFDELSFIAQKQIPFILHIPGQTQMVQNNRPNAQINVYPTIANLIGQTSPSSVLGHDMFSTQSSVVSMRKRSLGQNIEMVLSDDLVYIAGSGGFSDGKCFAKGLLVDVQKCQSLYDSQVERMKLSDKVVEGNRLDLLSK